MAVHQCGEAQAAMLLGLIILNMFSDDHPKEHGGLGFSALMHSHVVMKIASRSAAAAVTVMVPNSLDR